MCLKNRVSTAAEPIEDGGPDKRRRLPGPLPTPSAMGTYSVLGAVLADNS